MSDTAETVVVNHSEFPLPAEVHDWPGIRLIECKREGEIPTDVDGAVVLTRTDGGPNLADLLSRSPQWVHTVGTGVDAFPFDTLQGQTLTCSRGISGELIGEWVFAQMLAFAKALPDVYLDAPPDNWTLPDFRVGSLRGTTVVILGMGGIGAEVARLSLALGMEVIGVRRRGTEAPFPGMAVVNDIADVVGRADHVVVAAPSTPETQGMFDAELFGAMKPGVHFCNIARGTLVDQDALLAALDDDTIARASLDVCTPEPLPDGHWMYSHPKVLLTPHTSWVGPGAYEKMIETFHDNYLRFRAGEPLEGLVDVEAGY
ncbi:MAG: NAD(P)-dependent oxidoreductase [Actinomycetota bacterium]